MSDTLSNSRAQTLQTKCRITSRSSRRRSAALRGAAERDRYAARHVKWVPIQRGMAMTEEIPLSDLLFEVLTPLGFRVRVTRSYWDLIVTVKHPVMAGRENDVKETLQNPDEVRQSKSDPKVYLFYKPERIGRWVCAVAKRLDGDGYLITTYPTDAIKEGTRIWPK